MQKRALTGGKARTNSGRQSICSGAPALRLWRCCRRSHGRICPDAGYARTPDAAPCRAVRRALSMHVHQPFAQHSPGLPVGPSVRTDGP